MPAFPHLSTLAELQDVDRPPSSNPDGGNEDCGIEGTPFCQQIINIRQRWFVFALLFVHLILRRALHAPLLNSAVGSWKPSL